MFKIEHFYNLREHSLRFDERNVEVIDFFNTLHNLKVFNIINSQMQVE